MLLKVVVDSIFYIVILSMFYIFDWPDIIFVCAILFSIMYSHCYHVSDLLFREYFLPTLENKDETRSKTTRMG